MTFINAISSISYQNLFENKSLRSLKKLTKSDEIIQPNYKQWIKPMQLRRMSKIVRMGLGCTKDIVAQIGTENFDSVIVGTGLGCIKDTVKFIDTINSVSTSSIPPTAFIQSTHNTIAGQIALLLSNNNYNMTYVQNGVSFEHALLDAHIKILEGENNVLVGALDEMTEYLQNLAQIANVFEPHSYTEGSSFFNLANKKDTNTFAQLVQTLTFSICSTFSLDEKIEDFLRKEGLSLEDIDIIFQSRPKFSKSLKHTITDFENIIYQEDYCGKYFTSSAFAFYLACQAFKEKKDTLNSVFDINIQKLKYSLIINNYMDKSIGFTLLKSIE